MEQHVLAPSVRAAVVAHYERAAPLIVANFPLAPVTPVAYPKGLDHDAHYDAPVYYPVPPHVTTISVSGSTLIPYHSAYLRASASRRRFVPQVIAY